MQLESNSITSSLDTPLNTPLNTHRVLFKPSSWLSQVDFINHLILFNNVIITILSEKEGGKTSFGTLLQNNLDQQVKAISMTIKPPCDSANIINEIAAQLHLNHDARTDFSSIVAQINERKAHVLLLLDGAQHVPESFIKETMIAIKNQEDFGFFHLCFISDYSLVATLNSLAVEQFDNLVHTIELGTLNESETRTYVLQRAMTMRLISKPLTDVQFKQIYQLTKGNVAKINSNLEAFISKCSAPEKNSKGSILKKISMAASAAVVLGGSYIYVVKNHLITDLTSNKEIKVKAVAQPEVQAVIQPEVQPIAQPLATAPQVLMSYIAHWQDSSTIQLVENALPRRQVLDEVTDEEQDITTVALVDKVVVIPTVKKAGNTMHEMATTQVVQKAVIALKEKTNENTSVVAKIPSTYGYTIQLVASHNINDLHEFRKKNNLKDNTLIRHFTNAKGNWYILTLGEFNSRSNAQSHINKLPGKIAKLKPWIRPVSGLENVG